jgi:replicative DNA helicase
MDLMLPHSPEIEQIILGTLVQNREAIFDIADRLKAEYFHDEQRQSDYAAIIDLWQSGGAIDLMTVSYHIHRKGDEPIQEAMYRMTQYSRHVTGSMHLPHHVAILTDLWKRRKIATITSKIAQSAGQDDTDELRSDLSMLMQETAGDDSYAEDTLEALSYQHHNTPASAPAPKWGLSQRVDENIAARPGTVTIIGASPGSGKSAVALNMAMNIAEGCKVWFVSLEMPKDDVIARCDAMVSGIHLSAIMDKRMSDAQSQSAMSTFEKWSRARSNMVINHVGTISTVDFMAQASRKVRRDGVGLIVIDYLQIMTADARQFKTEYDRVTEISRVIRRTARELNVPIVALSQLKRREGGGPPTMTDLRSSGQIEQDAHVILLLHRQPDIPDRIMVKCAKNRNGMTFDDDLWCDLGVGRVGSRWMGSITTPSFDPMKGLRPQPAEESPF